MNVGDDITGYEWKNAEHTEAHDFLLPTVGKLIKQLEQKKSNAAFSSWIAVMVR